MKILMCFKTPVRGIFLAFCLGLLAATPALGQDLALPSLEDQKAIGEYLKKSDSDARYTLYEAYFQKAIFPMFSSSGIEGYFASDLEAAKPDKRIKMATLILTAAKRPASVRQTDAKGLPVKRDLNWRELVACLGYLTLYEETASLYYKALPLNGQSNQNFKDFSLEGKRASILLSLMPKIDPALSTEAKRLILANVLKWPSNIKNPKYDIASLRALQKILAPTSYPFLTALSNADASFQLVNPKDFLALAPDEEELSAVLPGIVRYKLDLSATYPVTELALRSNIQLSDFKALFAKIRSGSNIQLKAFLTLLDAMQGLKLDPQALLKQVTASKDDWESFCLYRAAFLAGAKLSDEQVLAWVDPLRPSLAAAVLEDRYASQYFPKYGYEIAIINLDTKAVDLQAVYDGKILNQCLALKNPSDPRILLPVMNSMMLLGKAKYVYNIIPLMASTNIYVRESAYRQLLNFADSSMVKYFLQSLSDTHDSIRAVGIMGLSVLKDSRGIEPLAKILNDPAESNWIRVKAAEALGKIGDRRVAEIFKNVLLIPAGKGGDDMYLRVMAAQNLGSMYEKTAVNALLANIDPLVENELNYYCLESLGKLEDPAGFTLLIPIVQKGWEKWLSGSDYNDNLYAATWALFMYSAPEAQELFTLIWQKTKTKYSPVAYMAAYYLYRNSSAPDKAINPECLAFLDKNLPVFFETSDRVYSFARLLEKKWDAKTLSYLSTQLTKHSEAVQSWILSGMDKHSQLSFIPTLLTLKDSPSTAVRSWVAHNLATAVTKLPSTISEESRTIASDLKLSLDTWIASETDSTAISWIKTAQNGIDRYLRSP